MRLRDLERTFQDEKKVLRNGVLLMCLAALLVVLILKLSQVGAFISTIIGALMPVGAGIVVSYILNVFVHFFEDFAFKPFRKSKSKAWKKLERPLSVILAYIIVLLVVVFLACFIIPGLVESASNLAITAQRTVPGYVSTAVNWVADMAQKYDLAFVESFIESFNWSSVFQNVTNAATDFIFSLVSVTTNVASGMFTLIMGFIFSIYMLFGKEKLVRGLKSSLLAFFPTKLVRRLNRVGTVTNQVFFSFIRGMLTECVILGTLCYVGMNILGLDYALLISSMVAFGALIPILGAYISAAVGAVILLLVHPFDSLIFLIFLICLQQLEGNLIYPRVVGSSIGLPPVWTLFAVLFWGSVLGIPGILIGTPLTAVIYRLFRSSVRRRLREKGIDPEAPSLPEIPPAQPAPETASPEPPAE